MTAAKRNRRRGEANCSKPRPASSTASHLEVSKVSPAGHGDHGLMNAAVLLDGVGNGDSKPWHRRIEVGKRRRETRHLEGTGRGEI